VSCQPEKVTGFVDGALEPEQSAAIEAHLAGCDTCREQAEAERRLAAELRALPAPEPPAGLEARLATRLRPPRRPLRWALPLAAMLLLAVWLRGSAPYVAWAASFDHDKCFSRHPLPAKVWSSEMGVVAEWFEARGTRLPYLPERIGELTLVGARYCPLLDASSAPHLYYASGEGRLSILVVPHGVRFDESWAGEVRGNAVRLLRVGGAVVALVGDDEASVDQFARRFRTTVADATTR
jgi:hypothetical protein